MQYTVNDFLGGMVRLKQPVDGLRAGTDAVLLSAAVTPEPHQAVLDVGCGSGVVALCVGARTKNLELVGVEIQPELALLAQENARLNEQNLTIVNQDIQQLKMERFFEWVVTNPPFYTEDPKRQNEQQERAFKKTVSLKVWIDFCLKRLKPKGRFAIIYRTDGVPEILSLLNKKLGGITLIPIYPKQGQTPKRVIITGQLGSKTPFSIHRGIILHYQDNRRTKQAESVMRQGKTLFSE